MKYYSLIVCILWRHIHERERERGRERGKESRWTAALALLNASTLLESRKEQKRKMKRAKKASEPFPFPPFIGGALWPRPFCVSLDVHDGERKRKNEKKWLTVWPLECRFSLFFSWCLRSQRDAIPPQQSEKGNANGREKKTSTGKNRLGKERIERKNS